jgi:putative transposase
VIDVAVGELEPLTSVKRACELLGKSRATLHRQRNPEPPAEKAPPAPRAPHPAALTAAEQQALLAVLDSERFADKSPAQVYAILLDDGIYLASIRTMYRVLTLADQVRERRAQAAHPPRVRPELVADGPDQVWTWDITKLKGPWRGTYFDLYVMLDIFSRKAICWEVHITETGELAEEFMRNAIIANGGARPLYVHADNGTSMTSKNVATLLSDLNITRSHSRPHVSDDNPFSEAIFKTFKYCPVFPGTFANLDAACAFSDLFFTYYNNEHRHSGIGLHTPASVHDGTAWTIQARRQLVLDGAFAARPDRFRGRRPLAPALPAKVWINKPRITIETQESRGINPAA